MVYVQRAKLENHWLVEINTVKHYRQILTFRFRALNLVEKAVLHFLLIMLDYVKNAFLNK